MQSATGPALQRRMPNLAAHTADMRASAEVWCTPLAAACHSTHPSYTWLTQALMLRDKAVVLALEETATHKLRAFAVHL